MHQAQWSPERPLPPPVSLASPSHHEKPPEVTCTSRGNPGFPASTRESPRETSFNTSRGQIPLPRAFLRRLVRRSTDAARPLQHAIHAAGADGYHVAVEHHKRQPSVAFQRILEREAEDRLLFPVFEPPVARHPTVVLVPFAVAVLPVVELARAEAQPGDELPRRDLRSLLPTAHVIDHFIAGVVGNPTSVQSSPLAFFARTFSSISSAMTSFFCWSLLSRRAILSS